MNMSIYPKEANEEPKKHFTSALGVIRDLLQNAPKNALVEHKLLWKDLELSASMMREIDSLSDDIKNIHEVKASKLDHPDEATPAQKISRDMNAIKSKTSLSMQSLCSGMEILMDRTKDSQDKDVQEWTEKLRRSWVINIEEFRIFTIRQAIIHGSSVADNYSSEIGFSNKVNLKDIERSIDKLAHSRDRGMMMCLSGPESSNMLKTMRFNQFKFNTEEKGEVEQGIYLGSVAGKAFLKSPIQNSSKIFIVPLSEKAARSLYADGELKGQLASCTKDGACLLSYAEDAHQKIEHDEHDDTIFAGSPSPSVDGAPEDLHASKVFRPE